ncbi:hypothetical protein CN689_25025 [Peribacillus butanolivorans]|uniref:Uncharacterized protein n=1 Tax=Peribacillus butanolivorans TaxID=421767 RepID=A0AAX0RZ86_9BACI|nr:hypothetical protein CN689_25025 [Peribacillus butanolivorans]
MQQNKKFLSLYKYKFLAIGRFNGIRITEIINLFSKHAFNICSFLIKLFYKATEGHNILLLNFIQKTAVDFVDSLRHHIKYGVFFILRRFRNLQ